MSNQTLLNLLFKNQLIINFKKKVKMKATKLSIQKRVVRILSSTMLMAVVFILNSAFTPMTKLTDPQIAMVAVTANQNDINAAKMAKTMTKNTEVLKFADDMIKDHQSVIDQAQALVKKLKVIPVESDLSMKLNADAASTKKMLTGKTGKEFDKAYIDSEVAYHKLVINTVQNDLIPQTQNAELKALLVKVVPILRTHLQHAEMVQKMFVKK